MFKYLRFLVNQQLDRMTMKEKKQRAKKIKIQVDNEEVDLKLIDEVASLIDSQESEPVVQISDKKFEDYDRIADYLGLDFKLTRFFNKTSSSGSLKK
jgi:hypothetical protein